MTFISYAQNFEDVMLWRALQNIDCGFYLDVGANDPEVDSVTKAFYDRGWRGINIEPVAQWFERLQQARPRDVNLQVAAGAGPGSITLYELPKTGLSTTSEETAVGHEAALGFSKIERTVAVETVTSICERFHVAPIHFLKIDVEGTEATVLQGIDFSIVRPWIIVIEATRPLTQTQDHERWESIVLAGNYEFVYFDGLNRFYVSAEHRDLAQHFKWPPNVFDGFELSGIASQPFCKAILARAAAEAASCVADQQQLVTLAEERAVEQEHSLTVAEKRAEQADTVAQREQQRANMAEGQVLAGQIRIAELSGDLQHWQSRAGAFEVEVNALRNSWSWRVTATLRWVAGGLFVQRLPVSRQPKPRLTAATAIERPVAAAMRVVL
ncbi:MAG: FkbM family methyltransferase, partial [Burkholderiaceae bacterium]